MKNKKTVKHRPGTIERRNFKLKVRRSPEWNELRRTLFALQDNTDPITCSKLERHAECHHLSQEWRCYDNLSLDRFVLVNRKTHSTIHFLYDLYTRLGSWDFLHRMMNIVEQMKSITENDTNSIEENTNEEAED